MPSFIIEDPSLTVPIGSTVRSVHPQRLGFGMDNLQGASLISYTLACLQTCRPNSLENQYFQLPANNSGQALDN